MAFKLGGLSFENKNQVELGNMSWSNNVTKSRELIQTIIDKRLGSYSKQLHRPWGS